MIAFLAELVHLKNLKNCFVFVFFFFSLKESRFRLRLFEWLVECLRINVEHRTSVCGWDCLVDYREVTADICTFQASFRGLGPDEFTGCA